MAGGPGIAHAGVIDTLQRVQAFRTRLHQAAGPQVAVIKVASANAGMVLPPRDGVLLKHRFRTTLLEGQTL